MKRAVVAGLCWAVFSILAGGAEARVPLLVQRIGNWMLTVHAPGKDAIVTHCSLLSRAPDGAMLVFSIMPDASARLMVQNVGRDMPSGTIPMSYWVAGQTGRAGDATVVDDTTVIIALPEGTGWFDQLGAGRSFDVKLQDRTYRFNLAGMSALLPALRDCPRRYRDQAAEATVPAPASRPAATAPGLSEAATEAARWAERLSAEGAMPRAGLMTAQQMAQPQWGPFFRNAVAGWFSRDTNTMARLEVLGPQPDTLSTTALALSDALTQKCDRDFTVTRGGRDDRVIGIYVDCQVKEERMWRGYVIFNDKNGFLYRAVFLGSIADGRADDVALVAEDFRRAGAALIAGP